MRRGREDWRLPILRKTLRAGCDELRGAADAREEALAVVEVRRSLFFSSDENLERSTSIFASFPNSPST